MERRNANVDGRSTEIPSWEPSGFLPGNFDPCVTAGTSVRSTLFSSVPGWSQPSAQQPAQPPKSLQPSRDAWQKFFNPKKTPK